MKVLITGANGFIGRNLMTVLSFERPDIQPLRYDLDAEEGALDAYAQVCDVVVHLAGVNRPKDEREFETGNTGFTGEVMDALRRAGNRAPVVMTSSIQATLNNAYGRSKLAAEECLRAHAEQTGAPVNIYRLPNVFGKGCRPNYNSAVATFCHNIARGLPIEVRDPAIELSLVYIDDVVRELVRAIDGASTGMVEPVYRASLGQIVALLEGYKAMKQTLYTPDVGSLFSRKLYATYLSYLPGDKCAYPLTMHEDARGAFTEFMRTDERGQTSINVSRPGVVKGNHFHHTKNEKFLVVHGRGVIRLRHVSETQTHEYFVDGDVLTVVDILPGYTHNIENLGDGDMVTVMWSSECFDPDNPDTYALEV